MKVLNVLLLALFTSPASWAKCIRRGKNFKDKDKVKEKFKDKLEAVEGVIPDEYLVMHDEGVNPHVLLSAMVNSGQAEILDEFTLMSAFSVRMKRENLDLALKNIGNVTVFENPVVTGATVDSPVLSWGIDRSDQTIGLDNQYEFGRDAENVDVYVLDTGIFIDHVDFEDRARNSIDVTGEGSYDGYGHGTHVAGTFPSIFHLSLSLSPPYHTRFLLLVT
jgi:subtilisin family serine protease